MSETILPEGWSRPPGYSNGVVTEGGRRLAIGGQIGKDMVSGEVKQGFGEQWTQTLANIVTVVRAAGGEAADITALRIYVTSIDAYHSAGGALAEGWKSTIGKHFPAMTLVEVTGLMEPEALLEIEGEAVLS